jgi:hypothetical protein
MLSRILPAALLLLGVLPAATASRELLPLIADAELDVDVDGVGVW